MSKKGQQHSFQYEINTDEDLMKYLERKGLIVLDIYTDWCGPCVGMLNNLKKIKLELGGDNLNLAIVKSDTVEILERFRNRSEPTWMFIVNGRSTDLLFGANVPRLTQIITRELEMLNRPQVERKTYAINELQPQEVEIVETKRKTEEENARIEREAEEQKRKTYLDFCTNSIMEHLPENGIMIFGPHINRDSIKKILEIADKEKLQPKDRKLVVLEPSQIEVLNYASTNPIDSKVLDQMYGKELIIVMWKLAEGETRPMVEALLQLRDIISKPYPDENSPDTMLPPLFPPLEIKILGELDKKLNEPEENILETTQKPIENDDVEQKDDEEEEQTEENRTENVDEKEEIEIDPKEDEEDKKENDEHIIAVSETKNIEPEINTGISSIPFKIIKIPAAWTPDNKRTNATGLYVFFRQQTLIFLPPDPIPDPPHIIIIFDAYKKKEITDIMIKCSEDILSYGYFTTEDPTDNKLIANSTKNYENISTKSPTDKIIVKISKKTSDTLLAFAKLNPSYVSENCVIGEEEAKKFFPIGYKTGEQQEADEAAASKAAISKRKSKKKEEAGLPEEDQDNNSPPEGSPT